MSVRSVVTRLVFCAAVCALALATTRSADVQAQAPQTHTFVPDKFYNTFSGAHPPALRIKPGDRVVTKTVDAAGTDWNEKQVANGPNPQTGPFYVDGAEPGDMLVVAITKLETNRRTAYSSSLLAPYTVDPTSLISRVDRDPRRVTWLIDKTKGVARLDAKMSPTSSCPCARCSAAWAWRRHGVKRLRRARRATSAATWTTPVSTQA